MTRPSAATKRFSRTWTAVVAGAGVLVASASAAPQVTVASSTFDSDAAGWTVLGEAQGPDFHPTGGRKTGYISATDPAGSTGTSYWRAPAAFLGSQAQALNGKLSYDVRSVGPGSTFRDPDVSVQGGGLVVEYRQRKGPRGRKWLHVRVKLNGKKGWTDASTGLKATPQQMQTALSSLDTLLIRGEFRNGAETFDIDNVVLRAPAR